MPKIWKNEKYPLSLQRNITLVTPHSMKFARIFKDYLSLSRDKIENTEAVEAIVSGTEFKGTSLWILVCAIFIASLGLNMNSTAVIIGAMLISPLMGPIMGIGLGLGINDTHLVTRSLKNLAVATLFSLMASALYFWISPLNDARSELLARTQPTIYDVLIAFFGGFAGIIATGSRHKGNILPGVAIATALMPPLCTAGYGLATAQWQFVTGASYLFLINCVYIGLATWLGCVVLQLPKINAPTRISRPYGMVLTAAVMLAVLAPSVVTTLQLISENLRDGHVAAFAHKEFDALGNTQMVSYRYVETDSVPVIEVVLVGDVLDEREIELKAARMNGYSLPEDCLLKVVQGSVAQETSVQQFSKEIIQSMIHAYQNQILTLQRENDSLRNCMMALENDTLQEGADPQPAQPATSVKTKKQ